MLLNIKELNDKLNLAYDNINYLTRFGEKMIESFDSMTADRPYRSSLGIDYAVSEFKKYSGSQFDSQVVEAFLKVLNKS